MYSDKTIEELNTDLKQNNISYTLNEFNLICQKEYGCCGFECICQCHCDVAQCDCDCHIDNCECDFQQISTCINECEIKSCDATCPCNQEQECECLVKVKTQPQGCGNTVCYKCRKDNVLCTNSVCLGVQIIFQIYSGTTLDDKTIKMHYNNKRVLTWVSEEEPVAEFEKDDQCKAYPIILDDLTRLQLDSRKGMLNNVDNVDADDNIKIKFLGQSRVDGALFHMSEEDPHPLAPNLDDDDDDDYKRWLRLKQCDHQGFQAFLVLRQKYGTNGSVLFIHYTTRLAYVSRAFLIMIILE
jgi:hypothetical protein